MNKNYDELNGLKALGCLMVLLNHFNFGGLFEGITSDNIILATLLKIGTMFNSPGAIDLFFCGSGFFIAFLLHGEMSKTGTINFKNFFIRRAKRIYSALIPILIFVYGFTWFFNYNNHNDILYIVGAFFCFTNILRDLDIPHQYYLGHTWSLSIEEQFYLIFPFVFLILSRYKNGKYNIYFYITIFFISIIYKYFLIQGGANLEQLNNKLLSNVDSFAIGILGMYFIKSQYYIKYNHFFAKKKYIALGMFLFFVSLSFGTMDPTNKDSLLVWIFFGKPIFLVLNIYQFLFVFNKEKEEFKFYSAVFANKFMVYIGERSYGIYLWHYPIFEFIKGQNEVLSLGLNGLSQLILAFIVTIMLAHLSYKFIEYPILYKKKRT